MVEQGEIVSCREQRAVCAFVRHVFATELLWLDRERLDAYESYQRYFPFDLEPDELFVLALMLCTYSADGAPRFDELLLYVGRGYGKNGLITFLTFCLISKANGIREYNVDVAATTEKQAMTSFKELSNILDARKDFFKRGFRWTKTEIENASTRSVFTFWTGNSGSKDGMRSGALIFDEIHAYESNATMAVFEGGLGKRPDARTLKITTDGNVREGPLDEDLDRAHGVLFDEVPDEGFLPMLFKLDDKDEIHDESCWPKANPAVTRRPDLLRRYRRDYKRWLEHPQKHPEVPTKRFNCPEQRTDIAITSWDNLVAASRDMGDLSGLPCVLGIDYALTTDMLGACLLFHRGDEWQALHHAWWCTRSADAGEVKAPLGAWADMGLVTIVDDVNISPELPCRWALEQVESLGATLVMAALDDYRLGLMKPHLRDVLGLDSTLRGKDQCVYVVRPSDQMRIYPVLDSVFANRAIAWGDSPLMRWCVNNAKAVPAPNDNFKYGKIAPHSRKTDVFMALVAAFSVGDRIPEEQEMVLAPPVFF